MKSFRLWLITPLALACASCASLSSKGLSKTEKAQYLVEIAAGALREGDPIGALEQLKQAEELNPKSAELHHTKALAFHAKGEEENALKEAKLAIQLQPDYSAANTTLGKLLLDAGKLAEAEPLLEKAASDSVNREAYKALTNLGILHYRKGDNKKARIYLSKAIESSKNLACIAYYYKGHIDLKEAKVKDAISSYHSASNRLCSGFAEAHMALAMTYERSGQYDLARRKYLEIQQQFNSTNYADRAIQQLRNMP
jgi:Tfp pilus assembly protein PilF